jgi:hypothetical protein
MSIAEGARGESISAGCLYMSVNQRQMRQYWSRVGTQEQAGRQDDFQPNTAHVQRHTRVPARSRHPLQQHEYRQLDALHRAFGVRRRTLQGHAGVRPALSGGGCRYWRGDEPGALRRSEGLLSKAFPLECALAGASFVSEIFSALLPKIESNPSVLDSERGECEDAAGALGACR